MPPAVQSAAVQHAGAVFAAQVDVPGHRREVLSQLTPHIPPLQVAVPCKPAAGQAKHCVPHDAVSVSDRQMPLQLCVPLGHDPLQAVLLEMQAPLQILLPDGHAGLHASPSQDTVPPVGAAQAEHEVLSLGPQVATALLSTQAPLHTWKPLLHFKLQLPDTQAAAPFASAGQLVHMAPQAVASSSAAQRVPQRW